MWVEILTKVYLFILVIFTIGFLIDWIKLRRILNFTIKNRFINNVLPVGTRIYCDSNTNEECRRCKKGKILRRNRYVIIKKDYKNKTTLAETTRVYKCNYCSFRGLSPQKYY